jgi:hypothetical protein
MDFHVILCGVCEQKTSQFEFHENTQKNEKNCTKLKFKRKKLSPSTKLLSDMKIVRDIKLQMRE